MSNSARLLYVDFLKGVAIALVVLGHSVQVLTEDFYNDWLFNAIYSFHMPLFMFLSGFFYNNNIGNKETFLSINYSFFLLAFVFSFVDKWFFRY